MSNGSSIPIPEPLNSDLQDFLGGQQAIPAAQQKSDASAQQAAADLAGLQRAKDQVAQAYARVQADLAALAQGGPAAPPPAASPPPAATSTASSPANPGARR